MAAAKLSKPSAPPIPLMPDGCTPRRGSPLHEMFDAARAELGSQSARMR
jgi:hypothetical protein